MSTEDQKLNEVSNEQNLSKEPTESKNEDVNMNQITPNVPVTKQLATKAPRKEIISKTEEEEEEEEYDFDKPQECDPVTKPVVRPNQVAKKVPRKELLEKFSKQKSEDSEKEPKKTPKRKKQKSYEKREQTERAAKKKKEKEMDGKYIHITRSGHEEFVCGLEILMSGDNKYWKYTKECLNADYLVIPGELYPLNAKIMLGLAAGMKLISIGTLDDIYGKKKKIGMVEEADDVLETREILDNITPESYNQYLFFGDGKCDEDMYFKHITRLVLSDNGYWEKIEDKTNVLIEACGENKKSYIESALSKLSDVNGKTYYLIFNGMLLEVHTKDVTAIKTLALCLGKQPVQITSGKDIIKDEVIPCGMFYKFLTSGKEFSKLFDEVNLK